MYYVGVVVMLLLAVIGVVRAFPGFVNLIMGAGAVMGLIGLGRPLYRSAVHRVGEQDIVCRFVPWYQSTTLSATTTFPVMGVAVIWWGRDVDSAWLRFVGYVLLALGVAFIGLAVFQCTNRLIISPAALRVRVGRWFDIPREQVVAIRPMLFTSVGTLQTTRHWDLVYVPAGGGANRIMAQIDRQFSVDPDNLAAALQVWKDGDPCDPGLPDRVERLLRGTKPDSSA